MKALASLPKRIPFMLRLLTAWIFYSSCIFLGNGNNIIKGNFPLGKDAASLANVLIYSLDTLIYILTYIQDTENIEYNTQEKY